MHRSLLATTAAVLTAAAWGPALAQCETDAASTTTICVGDDTDGFEDASDGAFVAVDPGATVSSDGDAIRLDGVGSAVDNAGTLTAGDDGIQIGQDGTVFNSGTITAADDGVNGDDLDGVQVFNSGTIQGGSGEGNRGVVLGTGADGVVENSGLIAAFDEAIEAGDDAIVLNTGEVRSDGEDGVQVQLDGEIINEGTIFGGLNNGDGIDIDSGYVLNEVGGLIESRARGLTGTEDGAEAGIDVDEGEGSVTIENYGTIRGEIGVLEDFGNTAGHVLVNGGEVVGTGGLAVEWNEGDDVVELLEGGVFDGAVRLGEGEDDLYLTGIMDLRVGGENAFFDGGDGDDLISFDLSVSLGDIVGVAMSSAFADATELAFLNEDGSRSVIVFTGFELFEVEGLILTLEDFADAIPLPGALALFLTGLGGAAAARRRARAA